MRVTGGVARGQRLKVPKNCTIRPTTDLVRKAAFTLLEPIVLNWSRVLDLYAGTGALGIEALSRDAQWVDFVDQEVRCCAVIKQNLEKMGFAERAHVYCCSVTKAFTFLNDEYAIIFTDPPYSTPSLNDLVLQLVNVKLAREGSLVVIFHASRFTLNPVYGGLHLLKERRYGDTSISIYQKEAMS